MRTDDVSTYGQTTANEISEIRADGVKVKRRQIVSETVLGLLTAREWECFAQFLDRMEDGDVQMVTKMNRPGRHSMYVRAAVEHLAGMGVNAVAELERTEPDQFGQGNKERSRADPRVWPQNRNET